MVTQVILLYIDSSLYCYWYSDLVTSALEEENKRLADSLEQEKKERSQGSVSILYMFIDILSCNITRWLHKL